MHWTSAGFAHTFGDSAPTADSASGGFSRQFPHLPVTPAVICYRRDLIAQAGIDEDSAFGSIEILDATIRRLAQSSLEIPWLNPLIVAPYNDYLHTAASWVWGSGGQFIDDKGGRLVLTALAQFAGSVAGLIPTALFGAIKGISIQIWGLICFQKGRLPPF